MQTVDRKNVSAATWANEDVVACITISIYFVRDGLIASRLARRSAGVGVATLTMRRALAHLGYSL
jgi:hypothetical protein